MHQPYSFIPSPLDLTPLHSLSAPFRTQDAKPSPGGLVSADMYHLPSPLRTHKRVRHACLFSLSPARSQPPPSSPTAISYATHKTEPRRLSFSVRHQSAQSCTPIAPHCTLPNTMVACLNHPTAPTTAAYPRPETKPSPHGSVSSFGVYL